MFQTLVELKACVEGDTQHFESLELQTFSDPNKLGHWAIKFGRFVRERLERTVTLQLLGEKQNIVGLCFRKISSFKSGGPLGVYKIKA